MCEVTDIGGFSPRGKIYYMEERATPITQSGLYLPLPLSFIGPILNTKSKLNLDYISPFTSYEPSPSHQKERARGLI